MAVILECALVPHHSAGDLDVALRPHSHEDFRSSAGRRSGPPARAGTHKGKLCRGCIMGCPFIGAANLLAATSRLHSAGLFEKDNAALAL